MVPPQATASCRCGWGGGEGGGGKVSYSAMCWGQAQSPAPLGGQSLSHRTGGVEQDPSPRQACHRQLSLSI